MAGARQRHAARCFATARHHRARAHRQLRHLVLTQGAAMPVQVSYPGVYIDEFAAGAPIQGVGTNTAAFIGVAREGPISVPTKVTSWEQFLAAFGKLPATGTYLWYAVRGFFQNGGQVCYIVRASTGSYQTMALNDRSAAARQLVLLQARQPGALGATATVADSPLLIAVQIYRPTGKLKSAANVSDMAVTLAADGPVLDDQVANRFKPGDVVSFSTGTDRRIVSSVSGSIVRFTLPLSTGLAKDDTMRLANTAAGAATIRLRPAAPGPLAPGQLMRGTILEVDQGANKDTQIVDAVSTEVLTEGPQGGLGAYTYRVTFRSGLGIQLDMDPGGAAATATSREIALTLTLGAVNVVYDHLSMDPAHPHFLVDVINNDSAGLFNASLVEPPPPNSVANAIPVIGAAVAVKPGTPEDLTLLAASHFTSAIDTLRPVKDVNFIAIPDRPATANQMITVQQALITHCELQADRFAVLDSDPGVALFGGSSLESQRRGLDSARGYAALYGPWLRVVPSNDGPPIQVPPSGHVCGIFARSDALRGVHKAPANEIVNGALGVAQRISLIEQGQLNLQGINIVQVFQDGGRPVLWGARTTATDTNWQYVNIRRLFLYLEKSIQEGIRWAVFEPNNLALWQKLKRTLTDFLTREWRDGALFGAKATDAFYVRIDEVLNPFSEQQLGRLHIEIGVRPSYPAEFIIVRIGIWDGGSDVSES
ncbi:phage tail sheath family protein (plasmid) [Ralstonia solanacearum]|uniref:phage tail sheath subtilisin-like domain-containing protein n=2 Tax=Ralstonia solanacearum TaxID=305 RepID=UPI00186910C9|nr:phage tail sheath subtilisin-like domain-containing protein [Ralstonia solanacearum]QOK84154.1 phage tail sheath family protein [Ralstonia solanacearum]